MQKVFDIYFAASLQLIKVTEVKMYPDCKTAHNVAHLRYIFTHMNQCVI